MDPAIEDYTISDVVVSTAGRDCGSLFYVIGIEEAYLLLSDGRGRTLENPKRKKRKHIKPVLRSETRVAAKLRCGDKVLNSELRRDLAFLSRELQAKNLGG